jgi:capsid protein
LYEEWLTWAILTQTLPVPEARFEKFNEKKFIGRTWTWIDPKNEVEANVSAIDNGLKSRTQVCNEQGLDFEEIAEELGHEKDLADKFGIKFGKVLNASPAPDPSMIDGPGSTTQGTPTK